MSLDRVCKRLLRHLSGFSRPSTPASASVAFSCARESLRHAASVLAGERPPTSQTVRGVARARRSIRVCRLRRSLARSESGAVHGYAGRVARAACVGVGRSVAASAFYARPAASQSILDAADESNEYKLTLYSTP